jgi:dTDP-glucose 4,6-dehydratase
MSHVHHLAAEYGRWNGEAYYENRWTTNVVGTHSANAREDRLVFFSSAEVYGDMHVMNSLPQ